MDRTFSFETIKFGNQTKISIISPIHKSVIPRKGPYIVVIAFFVFFVSELIGFLLSNFTITFGLFFSAFGCLLATLMTSFFLSRFGIVAENDKIQIGWWFWNIKRIKTIYRPEITDIRWEIQGKRSEYFVYLIVETSVQTHRFQPLGIDITQPEPRPELQQFLDSFLQEINLRIMN
ncbi:MAG: hypothetical protein ACFFFG_10510 [Candidatus Thorarchaeota archaeon]